MQELKLFVEQMRATSSSLEKVEILKQQSDFIKKVLEYTYNPYKQYYVTSKTCKKNFNIRNTFPDEDLFDLLDDLTNRNLTGHDAIAAVNSFTNANEEYEDLIHSIIDKDLKTRTGAKVINKAFPNLIPEFNVVNSLPILLYSVQVPFTSTTAKQRTPSNFLLAYQVSSAFSPNEANLGS